MGVDIYVTPVVNYWAVLVAAVAYFVLGALWYSAPLFGRTWLSGVGKTDAQVKADFSPLNLVWTFIMNWLGAYAIARMFVWMRGEDVVDGIKIGLVAGICIAAATVAIHGVMEKRPCSLSIVNALYSIVGFIFMGIIIGLWR